MMVTEGEEIHSNLREHVFMEEITFDLGFQRWTELKEMEIRGKVL